MTLEAAWSALTGHVSEWQVVDGLGGLLGWDQQTMMPRGGAEARGEQAAYVAKLAHALHADPRLGEWLNVLEAQNGNLDEVQRAALRNVRRVHRRATRIPADLVARVARAESAGFTAWLRSKADGDWEAFAPYLREIVSLKRDVAAAVDPSRHPYEVMLDSFDPGTTVAELKPLFSRLQAGLVELLDALRDVPKGEQIRLPFAPDRQDALFREVVAQLGYDFERGRMDGAEHPFSCSVGGVGDVRITVHIRERELMEGLFGAIHEAGHGMYEQGLPAHLRGTTVDSAASMGLHESQSRFWENRVGRSRGFQEWLVTVLDRHFPGHGLDADLLYRANNRVEPGFVRVAADEVTYNLHVIVRFEIELRLFEGGIEVDDLPEVWNDGYERTLGLRPDDPRLGVLQDVHWSTGAFGYFPSYTLGNLYAASFGAKLTEEHPDVWEGVPSGEFRPILEWLREHVHAKGHLLDASDRVKEIVRGRDPVADLLGYLWERHSDLHGLTR